MRAESPDPDASEVPEDLQGYTVIGTCCGAEFIVGILSKQHDPHHPIRPSNIEPMPYLRSRYRTADIFKVRGKIIDRCPAKRATSQSQRICPLINVFVGEFVVCSRYSCRCRHAQPAPKTLSKVDVQRVADERRDILILSYVVVVTAQGPTVERSVLYV